MHMLYSRQGYVTVLLTADARSRLSDMTVHTRSRLDDINITERYSLAFNALKRIVFKITYIYVL